MQAAKQLALCVLGTAAVYCLAANPTRQPMATAYHDGTPVAVTMEAAEKKQRTLQFGPWQLGVYSQDRRPRDKRLNLYVVVPGKQHHVDGWDDYDHNMVISAVPQTDEAVEWDVYWVLTLDPHMREELRGEREVLLTAQTRFVPGDLFEFDDLPADTVLSEYLHIRTLEDLQPYRHKDGTLPRILVLPAGCFVRMKVDQATETH